MEKPYRVFCCCAPEDKVYLQQLQKHLRLLESRQLILLLGEKDADIAIEWRRDARQLLMEAQIILLLLSPDFFASGRDRLIPRLMRWHQEGAVRVVPIILRSVDWEGDPAIGYLKPLPYNGRPVSKAEDQDGAFREVAQGIINIVEAMRKTVLSERTLFSEEDEALFRQPSESLSGMGLLQKPLIRTRKRRSLYWIGTVFCASVIIIVSMSWLLYGQKHFPGPAAVVTKRPTITSMSPVVTSLLQSTSPPATVASFPTPTEAYTVDIPTPVPTQAPVPTPTPAQVKYSGAPTHLVLTPPAARYGITPTAVPGCQGISCYGQDPTEMGCVATDHALLDRKPEYFDGTLIGYLSIQYSSGCQASWVEATLTSSALSQGLSVASTIETIDSQGNDEYICYPDNCIATYSNLDPTKWPTVSNLIDNEQINTVYATFYLVDSGGYVVWQDREPAQ